MPRAKAAGENRDVFFNCPFDASYEPFYFALIFTIMRCGFSPRCTRESNNAGVVRVENIYRIIKECRLGVHDISCTELDSANNLPRFNMPLELGIFLGATKFGSKNTRDKVCLVFDKEQYRYQKFISDIAGQDIEAHENKVDVLIEKLTDWLRQHTADPASVPGGGIVVRHYTDFEVALPVILQARNLPRPNMKFGDFTSIVKAWLLHAP